MSDEGNEVTGGEEQPSEAAGGETAATAADTPAADAAGEAGSAAEEATADAEPAAATDGEDIVEETTADSATAPDAEATAEWEPVNVGDITANLPPLSELIPPDKLAGAMSSDAQQDSAKPDSGEAEQLTPKAPGVSPSAAPEPPPPPPPPPPPASASVPPPPPPPPLDASALEASVDDLDIPPPTSVPVPKPFAAPKVVPSPKVNDIDVTRGSVLGETRITLSGEHLLRITIVRFGGELARPIGATEPREIRVMTPPAKRAGRVSITVQNPGSDEITLESKFEYEALPEPQIDSVAPTRVATKGGTEVSISGNNFIPQTIVMVGDDQVSDVKLVDEHTIDFKAPPGKHGRTMDVTVANPDGGKDKAPRAFMYDERYD